MQLKIPTAQFKSAMSVLSSSLSNKLSHPILSCVKITATDSGITLSATDLEFWLSIDLLNSEVIARGEFALPAKRLSEILSAQSAEETDLSVSGDECLLRFGKAKYKLPVMGNHDEMPEATAIDGVNLAIDANKWMAQIKSVLYAVSNDSTKQVLTGINITFDDRCDIATTDGHRLAVSNGEKQGYGKASFTLPAKTAKQLQDLINRDKSTILNATVSDTFISICGDTWILSSGLLAGQYPNYRQLIPKQFERTTVLDREELLGAIARIAPIAGQDAAHSLVRLHFHGEGLSFYAHVPDLGECEDHLALDHGMEDYQIGLNINYLRVALNGIPSDSVTLKFNSPTSPMVITSGDGDTLALIMPVQVRSMAAV